MYNRTEFVPSKLNEQRTIQAISRLTDICLSVCLSVCLTDRQTVGQSVSQPSNNNNKPTKSQSLERQTKNKNARIATMEPAIVNGWLTFGRTLPQVYINQWIDHPTGDHDDGPDGTEGCYRFRRGGSKGLVEVAL